MRNQLNNLSVRKKLAFSSVMVLIVCVVFEMALRLMPGDSVDLAVVTGRKKPSWSAIQKSKWAELDAFSAYSAKPGNYGSGKTVNSGGFISTPEIPYEKAPNEIRIVFLGESSTAGTGHNLPDVETWPWKARARLQKMWPDRKVTFINGALSGYTSFESYGRFWSRLRFYQPDIVVVFHGWNEMYYFRNAGDVRNWRKDIAGWENFSIDPVAQEIEPHWVDPYLQYSQIYSRGRLRFGARIVKESGERPWIDPAISLQENFDPAALEVWRFNLRLLKSACEQTGTELFVCKQCTLVAAETPQKDRERCSVHFHQMSYDAHLKAFDGIYKVIEQEIGGGHVVDATGLSGRPELFYDHIHPTEAGTSEIAEIVATSIAREHKLLNLKHD